MEKIPSMELPGKIQMPALGLGTWQLKGKKCTEAVKTALELGYRHIDTAEIYGNEKEIGKAIAGFEREKLFLVSKVWASHFRFKDVLKACDSSLKELGTGYLDLYLMHFPSSTIPMQETLKALNQLKQEGKIKALGVSNFNESQLEKALAIAEVATNQVEFHPLLYQRELLAFCDAKGIPVTAYSPIARGQVFKNQTIKAIAERHEKSPVWVSLKWLLQKGMIVIPKASSKEHLLENLDIFGWKLSREEVQEMDAIKERKRIVNLSF